MKNNKQKTEIPKKKTNTIISFLIFFIVVQSFFAYENIIDRLSRKFNTITSCFKNNDQIISNTVWPNFEVATDEELSLAHSKEYIELVDRQVSQLNNNRALLSTGDTPISKDSNLVAKLAVGAGLEAVDQIMAGDLSSAFALVRPPGHHASSSMGMGFCVYNSVAVVAKYLQKK